MANTAPHQMADVDAMTATQLAAFTACNYAALQEYARVLAIGKDQTTNGLTAAAAQTNQTAQGMRQRLYGT